MMDTLYRVEPEDLILNITFANDFHNLGGGYIIIGVGENNGRPVLPPAGLPIVQIDAIQKEIVELGYRIVPYYHPIIAPFEVNGRHILVLWAAGGQTRPYKAPVSLAKDKREFAYYVRKGPVTARAGHQDEIELMSLVAAIPFDDRMNQRADLNDLDLGLIRAYLKQINSDLFRESAGVDFDLLCRQMGIVDGPDESIRPKNVGLMFFNDEPAHFFPQTQIDVGHFPEGNGANSFMEKTFKGPLHIMLQDTLSHIHVEFPVHPVFAEALKKKDVIEVTTEVTTEVKRLLNVITDDHSRAELQEMLRLKNVEHFRKAYLLPAINAGLVEMTRPDKPKSRLQKYRLTATGLTVQKIHTK
ncbi:MAG: hypothetical protein KJP23_29870 [Deltaproteobacteria bacterium]|nr:hypothetical protein [Deltaproteobacteria bacterium]